MSLKNRHLINTWTIFSCSFGLECSEAFNEVLLKDGKEVLNTSYYDERLRYVGYNRHCPDLFVQVLLSQGW